MDQEEGRAQRDQQVCLVHLEVMVCLEFLDNLVPQGHLDIPLILAFKVNLHPKWLVVKSQVYVAK